MRSPNAPASDENEKSKSRIFLKLTAVFGYMVTGGDKVRWHPWWCRQQEKRLLDGMPQQIADVGGSSGSNKKSSAPDDC